MKSIQFPSTGLVSKSQVTNRGRSSGAFTTNEPPEATSYDPLIGRKVWTKWPDDNHFYEAVITDYNPSEVCLLYSTKNLVKHGPLLTFLFEYLAGTTCLGL